MLPRNSEVAVPKPLANAALSGRLKPLRRQRHYEHSSGTNRSADDNHPIGRKLLRERAYDRHEKNDDDRVDCGKLTDRSVEAELANAPLREHVVHLEKRWL